jgi:hypothetical protein
MFSQRSVVHSLKTRRYIPTFLQRCQNVVYLLKNDVVYQHSYNVFTTLRTPTYVVTTLCSGVKNDVVYKRLQNVLSTFANNMRN